MRLRHIQVLVTVAETGSIRSAARQLGLTQPALSKAVRQMETDFGVQMLTRTPRGVVLTEYGRTVLVRARSISAEIRRMDEEVAQLRGNMRGSVSVGAAPLPSMLILPQILPRFCAQNPEVEVRIVDAIYPTAMPFLRQGEYDFLVGPKPPDRVAGEFEIEDLMETRLVVVGRPGHPKIKSRRLADLVSSQWMTLGPARGPFYALISAFTALGLVPPKATIKSEFFASSLALIESSDFLSILPKQLADMLGKQQRLQVVALSEQLPMLSVALIRRAGVPLTPAAEAMATLVRRRANTISRK